MAKSYPRPKASKPLITPTESAAFRQAVAALLAGGITPHRPSPHQLKVGCYSYYPNRQKALKDGGKSEKMTLDAFLEKVNGLSTEPGFTDLPSFTLKGF